MKWMNVSDAALWDAAFGSAAPNRQHSVAQKTASNEDVVFVEEQPQWALYCVCDGHGGVEAAEHIRERLWSVLKAKLPDRQPDRQIGFAAWAGAIRQAVIQACVEIDEEFSNEFGDFCYAGSTLTVALSCGWFLTVANLGDSEAVVDTGVKIEMMTQTHRLEECEKERKRLTDAGVRLARLGRDLLGPADRDDMGLGPQRCWPGGLANSRSIGDLDGGKHIVASPHVKQCLLPHRGCRLIIGSDGLWDMISHRTACVLTRTNCNKSSAERLVTLAIYRNNWAVHDDTTALVIDFLPDSVKEFPQICEAIKRMQKRRLFACFCASVKEDAEMENGSALVTVAEVDCASEEPDTILTSLDKCNSYSLTERSTSMEA